MRILIAEPDPALAKRLAQTLRGLAGSHEEQPDIVMLAVPELPAAARGEAPALVLVGLAAGASPEQVLSGLLKPGCALIALAGDAAPQTRAACLLAGADDCLSKPLSMVELRARCLLALRRLRAAPKAVPSTLCFESLTVDRLGRNAVVHGRALALTSRELLILEQLTLAAGALVSRAALGRAVWQGSAGETNALDVHLAALRRKLRACAGAPEIGTVRGAGFQLLAAAASQSAPLAGQPLCFAASAA